MSLVRANRGKVGRKMSSSSFENLSLTFTLSSDSCSSESKLLEEWHGPSSGEYEGPSVNALGTVGTWSLNGCLNKHDWNPVVLPESL